MDVETTVASLGKPDIRHVLDQTKLRGADPEARQKLLIKSKPKAIMQVL